MSILRIKELEAQLVRRDEYIKELEENNDVLNSMNTNLQGRVDILVVKLAAEKERAKHELSR